jgi:cation transport ATPase
MIAGAAMALSFLLVIVNSSLLRHYRVRELKTVPL